MDFQTATAVIAVVSLLCGAEAYRRTAALGDKLPAWARELARFNVALCVVLAVWGCTTFALWIGGANLAIKAVKTGEMHKAWWLGPVALAWGAFSYSGLRGATTPR